jgi:phasin
MQEKMRAVVEKSIVETRANYAKVKSAADEANSAIEASYDAAKTGAINLHAKAIDAMKSHADANFEFFKSIVTVKSMADYVALHTEFARKQLEAMTAQTKEISALAQKVAKDTAGPIQAQVTKTFKIAV